MSALSFSHCPCVSICDSSIAASAGASHPDEDITSTIAWSNRIAAQTHPTKVRLHQRRDLHVRIRRPTILERHRGVVQHVPQRVRLPGPDRVLFKLRRAGDDLEQPFQLGLRRQRRREELDRGVRDVIVRPNHTEVERRHVHVVLDRDALGRFEIRERRFHELGERVGQVSVRHAGEVVIVRVLRQAAVVERPREVVDRVLLRLDRPRHDLRGHVVKLFVVLLPRGVAQQHAHAVRVHERPRRAASHLQKIRHGVIRAPGAAGVVILRPHDDRQLTRRGETPRERRGHDQHARRARVEDAFDDVALLRGQGLVQERDAKAERVPHRGVRDSLQVRRDVVRIAREEFIRLSVRGRERQKVERGELRVLSRRDEHDGGFGVAGRVLADGGVHRPRHRLHPGLEVHDVHALDVYVERHRPHSRWKVEHPVRTRAEPLAEVLRVRERRAQADDANRLVELRADVTHPARDHLHRRSDGAADEVQLVRDEQRDVLHVLPLLPSSADDVPLVRRRDDDLSSLQKLEIRGGLARQRDDADAERVAHARLPVVQALLRDLRRGRHVHAPRALGLAFVQLVQNAQDREFGADRLPAPRGRADERVVVRVVQALKRLRLHRVEVLQARGVQRVESVLLERAHGQRLEVEQLRRRRVLLGQEQVLEAHRNRRLRAEPAVGD
eukprot:30392-Pelagococcus_subviridis.AAC.4